MSSLMPTLSVGVVARNPNCHDRPMDFWGIIAIIAVAWVAVSVFLGVMIGRGIRMADVKQADADFLRGRGPLAVRVPARALASQR